MKTLVNNCRIITPYKVVYDSCIEIEGTTISGIISEIEAASKNYDKVLDCMGNYAAPGFIDIHNHGNNGYDAMDATPEALDNISGFHIKNGVTGFLATTMSQAKDDIDDAIKNAVLFADRQKEGLNAHSKLLGIYLEGPYFSKKKKGAQSDKYIKDPDMSELEGFIKLSKNYMKVVALAPELNGSHEMITYLKNRDIVVAAGHTDATYDEMLQAVDDGVTDTVHLFNGMRGFSHREPGPAAALLLDKRVACELICDGIHLHKAVVELAVKLKGADDIILISDAMRAAGLGDGNYNLGGQNVTVSGGIARLKDETLAGSTLTLDRAVHNVMMMADIPVNVAVQMATLNPAKLIGVSNRKGSIEPGKDADIIIFDEDIRIKNVIVEGHILSFKEGYDNY